MKDLTGGVIKKLTAMNDKAFSEIDFSGALDEEARRKYNYKGFYFNEDFYVYMVNLRQASVILCYRTDEVGGRTSMCGFVKVVRWSENFYSRDG